MKPRSIVYVDGYNWYHAIFKHHPEWKWLDVQRFFEVLRPREEVVSVKFFTAIVDEHRESSDATERHRRYVKALRTLAKVKVILGKFQDREVHCRADCRKVYVVPEEKKTDVNIAIEILSDAFANHCDSIVLVSGDSDAQPAIEWVKRHYPAKRILVYIPAIPSERASRRLDYYTKIGVDCQFLPLENIPHCLLPNLVKTSTNGDVVCKPSCWSKST
ncbi:MAG: NYN domain-containing protein [Verrucomicrobia bacterium]|nr:NYN domain-containing protein [Verrucomicrobiota bacterium]